MWHAWAYSPRSLSWSRLCVMPTIGEAHRESLRLRPRLPSKHRGLTMGSPPDWIPRED